MEIQSVTLRTDEPAEIYYTTDASEPTSASLRYASPIEISENTTLKIMAVDTAGNQCAMITEIYIIGDLVTDTDEDGMADVWEVAYFGDLSRDGSGDFDGDGLSDLDEYLSGTVPIRVDTDQDGMADGWEVAYGLNPLVDDGSEDPDGDGLTNLEEYNLGRHPQNAEPDKPILSLPTAGEPNVLLTPTPMPRPNGKSALFKVISQRVHSCSM